MSLNIERNALVVGEFDALTLLQPDTYPLSDRLHSSAAEQADALIRAEAEGLREEYKEQMSDSLQLFLPRKWNRPDLDYSLTDAVFEVLDTRADFKDFLRKGRITDKTRHALFCHRPDYWYNDTQFTFPHEFAGDLVPVFQQLQQEEYIHPQMDIVEDRMDGLNDERMQWYGRYSGYVAVLSTMAEGNDVAARKLSEFRAESTRSERLKAWMETIRAQF